jgi:hypothetical protein
VGSIGSPARSKTFARLSLGGSLRLGRSLRGYVEKFGTRGSRDDPSTGVSAVTMIPDARLRIPSIDAIKSYASIKINRGNKKLKYML